MNAGSSLALIVCGAELPSSQLVWGSGGWLAPEQREALDWLTLSRVLGWQVAIIRPDAEGMDIGRSDIHRIVIAGDPDCLSEEFLAQLAFLVSAEQCILVARAGRPGGAFARLTGVSRKPDQVTGHSLRWVGPGPERRWHCRNVFEGNVLSCSIENSSWATIDGAPAIVVRHMGGGILALLGFNPSCARDSNGAASALLSHLLIWGPGQATAWLDLDRTLVLRMDDPGGAENVHHQIYSHTKLDEADWSAIGRELRSRAGRLSIGYVSGWVDDADSTRGILKIRGQLSSRVPGKVHPSPLVRYEDLSEPGGRILHDYTSEYRGIQALRAANLADVELHGHTHMHPDTASWAAAPDRYESERWYRELGPAAAATIDARPAAHPLARGMAAFSRFFKTRPTTLICPGDQWTNAVLQYALTLGLQLVSSYYLAIRDGKRLCWAQHVCAPYLDQPDSAWFDSGLPVVGYFHDFDICRGGIGWFSKWLDAWRNAGAQRLIDFRELAAALSHRLSIEGSGSDLHLRIRNEEGPGLVRPLRIAFRIGGRPVPSQMAVRFEDRQFFVPVEILSEGVGLVRVHSIQNVEGTPKPIWHA